MALTKLFESKYYIEAKSKLLPNSTRLHLIPKHYTKQQKENLLQFWLVRARLKFLRNNLARASNRGDLSQEVKVDADYCYEIGMKKNWRCNVSGDEMEFERGGTEWGGKWCNPRSCTIDRIDSSKGYIKGNIQLVTWEVNSIKRHFDNNDFIELCKKVAKHNK